MTKKQKTSSFEIMSDDLLRPMNRKERRDKTGGNCYKRERKNEKPQYWRR